MLKKNDLASYYLKRKWELSMRGSIKNAKNLKGKYCIRPFAYADIGNDYALRCCCQSWMHKDFGDLYNNSIKEVWNSPIAQDIRTSILDGTYKYCNWHQCPLYSNPDKYLYTKDDLKKVAEKEFKNLAPWIQMIIEEKTHMEKLPAIINCCYDDTCNLKCPSCRTKMIVYNDGPEYEMLSEFQKKLLAGIDNHLRENHVRISLAGQGDPFASKIYREILFNVDGEKYPKLEISLQTNGNLMHRENWEKMEKIHKNISYIIISIDAMREETYKKIRVNGNFDNLMKNIQMIAEFKKNGLVKELNLAYVVQQKNYREMIDAINMSKELCVDNIIFNLITDWSTWPLNEFKEQAIWRTEHPEFNEFLKVLKDPVFMEKPVDAGNLIQYINMAKESGVEAVK